MLTHLQLRLKHVNLGISNPPGNCRDRSWPHSFTLNVVSLPCGHWVVQSHYADSLRSNWKSQAWNLNICPPGHLHVMSSLTEVDTGTLSLLFFAWHVKMECRSERRRAGMVRRFVTLNWEVWSKESSTIWWSRHQVTAGLGWPPRTKHFIITDSPIW